MLLQSIFLGAIWISVAANCNAYVKHENSKFPSSYLRNLGRYNDDAILVWTPWGQWTQCSRTCGGGVTVRSRACVTLKLLKRIDPNRKHLNTTAGCFGPAQHMRICNNQTCPIQQDFLLEQCAAFNYRPFKGRSFIWQPFPIVGQECTLNCRPLRENFYATLNRTVIDGTGCNLHKYSKISKNGSYKRHSSEGVCVNGYCMRVSSNGVVEAVDDIPGECSICAMRTCKTVNGIYTQPKLPPGYTSVTRIPKGACGIFVQQLKPSSNVVAIRIANGSVILKGEAKFHGSRHVNGAGVTFTYTHQLPQNVETVYAHGSIQQTIDVLVINHQVNWGIKYKYSIPNSMANSTASVSVQQDQGTDVISNSSATLPRVRLRKRFLWRLKGISPCSKSCGGGTKTYIYVCVRNHAKNQITVQNYHCAHMHQPKHHTIPLKCNEKPCASLLSGNNSNKSLTIPEPRSNRRQEVMINEKLDTSSGLWFTTEWSHCSITCGYGYQKRLLFCSGRRHNHQDCAKDVVPVESRECRGVKECGGQWFIGPWSDCISTICLTNSSTIRNRPIYCVTHIGGNPHVTKDTACPQELKPHSQEICPDQCVTSHWYFSQWSDCQNCPMGVQDRRVECRHIDGNSAGDCNANLRPISRRQCDCPKATKSLQTLQDQPPDDVCADRIQSCYSVVQARLCSYSYYRNICCLSCHKKLHE